MVDKEVLQKLHDNQLIDKRNIVWWQLGYEGRIIFSEEEFSRGLETIHVAHKFSEYGELLEPPVEYEHQVWKRDDVPILPTKIELEGMDLECFVSVRPQSHGKLMGEMVPEVYQTPHIRGLIAEITDKFMFWYSFGIGESNTYSTQSIYLKDKKMHCLFDVCNPERFCKNIIRNNWGHKSHSKKKALEYCATDDGFELVPYFDFDLAKKQVMIYPMPVDSETNMNGEEKLNAPIAIKTSDRFPYVEVIGRAYPITIKQNTSIMYWPLQKPQLRIVKATLERVLK